MTTELTKAAQQALEVLSEARKIIRASQSRQLAKAWDQKATAVLATLRYTLTQRPAAQTEDDVFMPRRLAATQKLAQLGYHYDSMQGKWLPDSQRAAPEPVGEVVYIAKGHLREVLNGNTMNAYLSPEPDRFADVALSTRPAPGVPGDSELLDYLDTLAARPAGSDLHCFGGRVALYVRTGIGSQIEASGAGTAREAIRAALAAAQAKGGQ